MLSVGMWNCVVVYRGWQMFKLNGRAFTRLCNSNSNGLFFLVGVTVNKVWLARTGKSYLEITISYGRKKFGSRRQFHPIIGR
jgi:hypothetical protein